MKRSNKTSHKLRDSDFVRQQDGTEVLRSKEARQKVRRWTFEADIAIVMPAKPANGDKPAEPEQMLPTRAVKLQGLHYGTAREARVAASEQAGHLQNINGIFNHSKVNVRAVPHETVSNETMRQILGFRDMAGLLDRALELSIDAAQDIISNKSVGLRFRETLAEPAVIEDGKVVTQAKPARTVATIKEEFYAQAVKEKTAELQTGQQPSANEAGRGEATEAEPAEVEGRKPFEPEIVEIQRAQANVSTADKIVGLGFITEEQAAQAIANMSV